MTLVSTKIFFVNKKVMISIKFPESAIKHIEMFIREIFSNFINIIFLPYLKQYVFKVWLLKVSKRDTTIIICVYFVKYTHYYCVLVTVLKFRSLLQELQPWMLIQKSLQQWLKVFRHNMSLILSKDVKEPSLNRNIFKLFPPINNKLSLLNFPGIRGINFLKKEFFQVLRKAHNLSGNLFKLFQIYLVFPFKSFLYLLIILLLNFPLCWFSRWKIELRDGFFDHFI